MTTISSSLPVSAYSATSPTATQGNTTVAKTSDQSLAQTAVTISAEASIVATLGASSGATPTYDAVGLLNALIQAGNPSSSSTSQASATTGTQAAQPSQDQAAAGSSASLASSTSGLYNASGVLQPTSSTDVTSNWASILKTNPELTSTVTTDAMNQGIVGSLTSSA